MEKQRVIVYIDGFNFYYGLRKNRSWRKYYWLDIVKFFESFMRDNQELVAVKYFSAKPDNEDKRRNQNALFQANKENSKFHLILGKYLKKEIKCFNCGYTIYTHEEKESDVRLATTIIEDVFKDACDISIVVSADSDMVPAVEIAQEQGHPVFVYFPPFQNSSNLRTMCGKAIDLNRYEKRFKLCILPEKITLKGSGFELSIPDKWKSFK